jgi:hypothetical protein
MQTVPGTVWPAILRSYGRQQDLAAGGDRAAARTVR